MGLLINPIGLGSYLTNYEQTLDTMMTNKMFWLNVHPTLFQSVVFLYSYVYTNKTKSIGWLKLYAWRVHLLSKKQLHYQMDHGIEQLHWFAYWSASPVIGCKPRYNSKLYWANVRSWGDASC